MLIFFKCSIHFLFRDRAQFEETNNNSERIPLPLTSDLLYSHSSILLHHQSCSLFYCSIYCCCIVQPVAALAALPLKVMCDVNFRSITAAVRNDEGSPKLYLRHPV